ncbi:MAG: alpha/beta fold hydrolase [Woeseiaceae bacterium]
MRKLCLLLCVLAAPTLAAKLPYEHFGHLPIVEQPSVSPNGELVAVVVNSDRGPTVSIAPFGSRDLTPIIQLKSGEDRIDWIEWANDDRLLVSASQSSLISGDRIRISRLFSIGADGQGLREIKRKTVTPPKWFEVFYDTTRIVSWLRDDPEHVLIELYDTLDGAIAVFKVNIYTNDFDKLFVNTYDVNSWFANGEGEVVFGTSRDEEILTFWYREGNDADWRELHSREIFESETFDPILVKGNKAYVFSDHEIARQGIWLYDIESGEFEELIYAAENHDVQTAILSVDRDEVVGATYYDHYRVKTYFDAEYEATSSIVDKSFSDYQTFIASRSKDRKRMIVQALRDDSPPKYFWLDLAKGAGGFWFSQYPYLEKQQLAKVQPFEYEARDGMPLNGYLTMPVDAKKKPPLVVFPHGGPAARDYQYFDEFVQFFANRGYAVLQMNFRGSEGFNNLYETAGYREWGQAMQTDIYDAVEWLEEQGTVNTDKACMVGASYGGYAALVAAFQQPERFKCIVSISGIADLTEHAVTTARSGWYEPFVVKTIGDPGDGEDRKMLDEASATNKLALIKRPILLIHGTHDTQVRVSQARDFYKKAKRAGVKVKYIELQYGTHYFDENQNRLQVFKALDDFLGKHL